MIVRILVGERGNKKSGEKFIESVIRHRHAEALSEAAPAGSECRCRTTREIRDFRIECCTADIYGIRKIPECQSELVRGSQRRPVPEVFAFDPALQLSGQVRKVITVLAVGDSVGRDRRFYAYGS